MDRVYIAFFSRADEAAGLVQLARHTRVDALPSGIYSIDRQDLKWLDVSHLNYRYATEEEVEGAAEGVRHPVATEVQ
jgi:hypothetical protein